jgi:hypothetical protein
MFTSRDFFDGLAGPLAASPQNLERTTRPLKPVGLWVQGTRGSGPLGEGVKAPHLAALVLAQAGRQPSDAYEVYGAIGPLPAEAAKPVKTPSALEDFAPTPGEPLAAYVARLIEHLADIDSAFLDTVEAGAEHAGWTLTLTASPPAAFVEWQHAGRPRRINFMQVQPDLLPEPTPRRVATLTAVPFIAISAAARLHAANMGSAPAPKVSDQVQVAPPENENAASPAREAARSSFKPRLTAQDGRSAPDKSRIYPISGASRKHCDSTKAIRPTAEPDHDYAHGLPA